MGRCVESPVVKLKGQGPPAPRLLWEPVKKGTEDGGEILVAFELFLVRLAVKSFHCKASFGINLILKNLKHRGPQKTQWSEPLKIVQGLTLGVEMF